MAEEIVIRLELTKKQLEEISQRVAEIILARQPQSPVQVAIIEEPLTEKNGDEEDNRLLDASFPGFKYMTANRWDGEIFEQGTQWYQDNWGLSRLAARKLRYFEPGRTGRFYTPSEICGFSYDEIRKIRVVGRKLGDEIFYAARKYEAKILGKTFSRS